MFDKLEYWKNRKAKKRGQGEDIKVLSFTPSDTRQVYQPDPIGKKPKFVAMNRLKRREKNIDRTFTKKGYRAGIKYTEAGYPVRVANKIKVKRK